MSYYGNDGIYNPAYHNSDTLEIDRGSVHHNSYHHNSEFPPNAQSSFLPQYQCGQRYQDSWDGGRWGWRTGDNMQMSTLNQYQDTEPTERRFQTELEHYDSSFSRLHRPSWRASVMGDTLMRRRGTLKVFPSGEGAVDRLTEEDIRDETEREEQDLVKELVTMSTNERMQALRNVATNLQDKRNIRRKVLASISSQKSPGLTCCTDCCQLFSLSLRRCSTGMASAQRSIKLWHGTMKEIGGRFGTSVLSYFLFLKWLLVFNIFSFLFNIGFITIPQLLQPANKSDSASFRGLELLTGAGFFENTVLYYGGYTNETISTQPSYNMRLAYFFTMAAYLLLCGLSLIYSMTASFRRNFVLNDVDGAWRLLCTWDFGMVNECAVRQSKNSLRVQLKESLSERAECYTHTMLEDFGQLCMHLCTWICSLGLAALSCAAVYYLSLYNLQRILNQSGMPSTHTPLTDEASTLLVPSVVSLINMVVPLFFSLLGQAEHYTQPRIKVYVTILRNVLLKMSMLGILCYFWMNKVATSSVVCWESFVGQEVYRLVVVDFIFSILGCFFGEFLRRVIGTTCLLRWGTPEFDIARNVLDLIYGQTLAWIGIYFSPLLPVIQILKFFVLFYMKKISLHHNCQPPHRAGRAAQMQTFFIALLFFPSFVGALSMVAYAVWNLKPSESCGPFQGLNVTFDAVSVWIEEVDTQRFSWLLWIYYKMIRSELFFFLLALLILILAHCFWQICRGRKELILLLRQQIVNVGKDKIFLLKKLQNLQKSVCLTSPQQTSVPKAGSRRFQAQPDYGVYEGWCVENNTPLSQAMLARQQTEEEEDEGY